MPEIVRVKIYDAGKRVVWSDEPRLLGEVFADNPELNAALAGLTTVNQAMGGIHRRPEPRSQLAAVRHVLLHRSVLLCCTMPLTQARQMPGLMSRVIRTQIRTLRRREFER